MRRAQGKNSGKKISALSGFGGPLGLCCLLAGGCILTSVDVLVSHLLLSISTFQASWLPPTPAAVEAGAQGHR